MKKVVSLSKKNYLDISKLLKINPKTDAKATMLLSKKMNYFKIRKTLKKMREKIKGKVACIFSVGPSLTTAIQMMKPMLKNRKNICIIAVDGAANALVEEHIPIDIIVTDLDGCLHLIKEKAFKDTIVVIHGHGDNIPKIKEILHLIDQEGFIGTTQVKETLKIKNFGGFTDGDRAAYLAANFGANALILIAFDFGKMVGRYSKHEHQKDFPAPERKLLKFMIAKKLLATLPNHFPGIRFHNATINGDKIENITFLRENEIKAIFK